MIIQHMKSDPNATKHAQAGFNASIASIVALPFLGLSYGFIAFLIAPFIMGVAIEVVQRLYRFCKFGSFTGKHQNTFKENYLDVMQTGLWYITFYVNKDKL